MELRSLVTRISARVTAAMVFALTLQGANGGPSARAEAEPPPRSPTTKPQPLKSASACTQLSGSTVSEAYGYRHVVSLRNGCDRAVECDVWTDVDPSPRHLLRAEKGETVQVITRIGSPASEFKPFKECRFR